MDYQKSNIENRYIGEYVYAMLFSDGWVKVGKTIDPYSRIKQICNISDMRNATLKKQTISGKLVSANTAELELISFCEQSGISAYGKEWFINVDYEALKKLIKEKFSGSTIEEFKEAEKERIKKDEASEELAKSFAKNLTPNLHISTDIKWENATYLANIMNSVFVGNLYGGEMFEPMEGFSISPFEHTLSLALHLMSNEQSSDLLSEAYKSIENDSFTEFHNEVCEWIAGKWAQHQIKESEV